MIVFYEWFGLVAVPLRETVSINLYVGTVFIYEGSTSLQHTTGELPLSTTHLSALTQQNHLSEKFPPKYSQSAYTRLYSTEHPVKPLQVVHVSLLTGLAQVESSE